MSSNDQESQIPKIKVPTLEGIPIDTLYSLYLQSNDESSPVSTFYRSYSATDYGAEIKARPYSEKLEYYNNGVRKACEKLENHDIASMEVTKNIVGFYLEFLEGYRPAEDFIKSNKMYYRTLADAFRFERNASEILEHMGLIPGFSESYKTMAKRITDQRIALAERDMRWLLGISDANETVSLNTQLHDASARAASYYFTFLHPHILARGGLDRKAKRHEIESIEHGNQATAFDIANLFPIFYDRQPRRE